MFPVAGHSCHIFQHICSFCLQLVSVNRFDIICGIIDARLYRKITPNKFFQSIIFDITPSKNAAEFFHKKYNCKLYWKKPVWINVNYLDLILQYLPLTNENIDKILLCTISQYRINMNDVSIAFLKHIPDFAIFPTIQKILNTFHDKTSSQYQIIRENLTDWSKMCKFIFFF